MKYTYTGDISDEMCNVKRLYVDLVISRLCPNCSKKVEHDYNQDYISYGKGHLNFYCHDGCQHEWEIETNVTATVTIKTKE